MRIPEIDDFVVLLVDRPEFGLRFGDVGVVRGLRLAPDPEYDVEFLPADADQTIVVMLPPEQIQPAPHCFEPESGSHRHSEYS